MQSKRFGVAWKLHQTLPRYAVAAIGSGDATILEALALSTNALGYVMPCRFCRDSFQLFRLFARADLRLQSARASVADYEQFYFDIHNLVNAKLDKPIVEPKDRKLAYDAVVVKSAQQFRCHLLEWLAMLAMNYDNVAPNERMIPLLSSAACKIVNSNGSWWRAAIASKRDLVEIVNEWIDGLLLPRLPARDRQRAATLDRWRRLVWHIVYLDAVLRIAESSGAPPKVRQCGSALRSELGLSAACGSTAAAAAAAALHTPQQLFAALHAVKRQCVAPRDCEPLAVWYNRIAEYRATKCSKGTCK